MTAPTKACRKLKSTLIIAVCESERPFSEKQSYIRNALNAESAAISRVWDEAIEIVQQLLPEKYQELRVVLQYGVMDEIRRDLVACFEAVRDAAQK